MTISTVSSNINGHVSNIKQNEPPLASSGVRGENENNGDGYDGVSSKVDATALTVITLGQTIATIINVTS